MYKNIAKLFGFKKGKIVVEGDRLAVSQIVVEENKAKDLLWKYVNEDNKKMLIHAANTDVLKRNNLELKAINISYQYN